MPAMVTPVELATTLKVEPSTVYRWAREGVVPSVRVGGVVRFRAVVVDELLRGGIPDETDNDE